MTGGALADPATVPVRVMSDKAMKTNPSLPAHADISGRSSQRTDPFQKGHHRAALHPCAPGDRWPAALAREPDRRLSVGLPFLWQCSSRTNAR